MNARPAQFRVGTSGYEYKHWKTIFYPSNLRRDDWFEYYAGFFDTVEMNNTFYHLPPAMTFTRWRRRAPAGFCYALKYSRYGSHIMHLKKPRQHIRQFLSSAIYLRKLLGPILVQLPPHWQADPARLQEFLAAAPRKHRWAFEFRHPSWLCSDVFSLLREHGAALCIHDKIQDHPREITADWTYLRYHGGKTDGNYPRCSLEAEATRIKRYLAAGLDVVAYFNNDPNGYALINAADLREFVTGRPNPIRQERLFW